MTAWARRSTTAWRAPPRQETHKVKDGLAMNEPLRRAPAPELLPRFAAIVGDKYAITDLVALAPFLIEGRGLYHGRTALLLRPGSVDEVVALSLIHISEPTR